MIIGKIIDDNKIYYSPIFAMNNNKVIILDDKYESLIIKKIYFNYNKRVFIIKNDYEEYSVIKNNFKSFWNIKNIFRNFKKKKYYSSLVNDAKEKIKFEVNEYINIKTKYDLEGLEFNVGYFHDAYILGMINRNDVLEILFDTSWGSLVSMKCKDVTYNSLSRGDSFCDCNMKFDGEFIELLFSNSLILKAKEIEYKMIYVKQLDINSFNYSFLDNEVVIMDNNNEIRLCFDNDYLDLKENNVIGYLELNEELLRCFIFCDNYVLGFNSFNNYKINNVINKFYEFEKECKERNLNFNHFPFENY